MPNAHSNRGKENKEEDIEITNGQFIEELKIDATYTYLGIEKNAALEHKKLREKARK